MRRVLLVFTVVSLWLLAAVGATGASPAAGVTTAPISAGASMEAMDHGGGCN